MNKKRFGSLSVRHWAMIFALAALTAVYVTRSDGSGLMAATTTRELPVYNVDTEEKVLSISFDAAWGNANTEGILNILDQYGVKTNFFLVGFWAEKYPELVAELQARGHEVGTGKPTTLFRPPYGEYNDEVVRISREEGYECIQWNVDSLDWKNISAEDMVRRCTKNVNPGDIVLFHNDSKYILQALPQILEYYQRAGYRVIPISELLLEGETWIDHAGTQHLATPPPSASTGNESRKIEQ